MKQSLEIINVQYFIMKYIRTLLQVADPRQIVAPPLLKMRKYYHKIILNYAPNDKTQTSGDLVELKAILE